MLATVSVDVAGARNNPPPVSGAQKATFCDRCHSHFVIVVTADQQTFRQTYEPSKNKNQRSSSMKIISAFAFATLLSLPASAAVASSAKNWKITAPDVRTIPNCPALEGYPDCHPDRR